MTTKHNHPSATYNRIRKEFIASLLGCLALILLCIILNVIYTPNLLWSIGPLLGFGAIIYNKYLEKLKAEERVMGHSNSIEDEYASPYKEDVPTLPDDELELKEFKKLRDEWKDQDFV